MGQAVARYVGENEHLVIAARFDRPGASGEGLVSQDEALSLADAVIDFTTPETSLSFGVSASRGSPSSSGARLQFVTHVPGSGIRRP